MDHCTCLCSGTCGVPGDLPVPLHTGSGWLFTDMAYPCTSHTYSDFYIMPIDRLSECFFDCVTHFKCHFIYGYVIAQSFICGWLHLFVAWLKWMHLQVYIKNHLSLWTRIWRKATECTFQCYFSFFGALFQCLFSSQRRGRISYLYRAIVWIK